MMKRHVKGVLFVDYVRMLRARKDVDWDRYLQAEDLSYLTQSIAADAWYPMAVFERMGLAILHVIAKGNLRLVQLWGQMSIDGLREIHRDLVKEGDPIETLQRFQVLRRGFFDFPAIEILSVFDGEAEVHISYHMGPTAEEAATHQTLGFLERLLESAGAQGLRAEIQSAVWNGAPRTLVQLRWRSGYDELP